MPRSRRWQSTRAVVLLALTVITGCTTGGVPSSSVSGPPGNATLTPSSLPTPSESSVGPSPASNPPAWVSDLAGQLGCTGAVASIGSEVPAGFGEGAPGASPEAGLASFLGPNNPFASLPVAGYTQIHLDLHWASYAHVFNDRAKVIIVLSDTTEFGVGWLVVGLRACDASEFDPAVALTFPVTIWTDASGKPVSTETIRSNPGPGHCGWDSVIFLAVDGNVFFRDPSRVMREWTTTAFDPDSPKPSAAIDTGFQSDGWSLWLDPAGDAYLVASERIERWPRSTDPGIGCA